MFQRRFGDVDLSEAQPDVCRGNFCVELPSEGWAIMRYLDQHACVFACAVCIKLCVCSSWCNACSG